METQLLTVDDIAGLLRVSRNTVHRYILSGTIPPPVRIGGTLRWQEDAVQQWLLSNAPHTGGMGRPVVECRCGLGLPEVCVHSGQGMGCSNHTEVGR